MGARWHGYMLKTYVYISITPTHVCNDNTNNLSKKIYDEHLEDMITYIKAPYHVVLGMQNVVLRSMEINCNIPLDDKHGQCTRVIKLLMSFCSKTLREERTYRTVSRKGAGATTYMRCNNSWAIVVTLSGLALLLWSC